MGQKTIMLVCAAGMSTSMLVTKMQNAAKDQGVAADIFAVAASEAEEKIAGQQFDTVLLGPQVRFMLKQFQDKLTPLNTPVAVINMADYGMMNGEKVLAQGLEMFKQRRTNKMNEENLGAIMGLIIHEGDAKSNAMEALQAAKKGNFEEADEKIKLAEAALVEAHHSQTGLLTQEAQGNNMEVSLLAVHGQDHLMTSITFTDLAKEIIELYKK